MRTTLIRPGLLVALKTTLTGGVSYEKRTIEEGTDGAASVATWQTTRVIADKAEHEAATVARGKARTAVSRVCCLTSFGLLCPEAEEEKLSAALDEAQRIAEDHNRGAKFTRVEVLAITGRVADSDERAARAIGSEVRELIAAMEAGIRRADPEAIREAANKARALSGMLSADVRGSVSAAIQEARGIAREIVRRVEKSGETAAEVVEGLQLKALQAARFAVLDLEPAAEAQAPDAPTGRALDLEPEEGGAEPGDAPLPRDLDLDVPPVPAGLMAAAPVRQFEFGI